MFLPDPVASLPNLVSTLQVFQKLSGLGVNLTKCSALPINIPYDIIANIKELFGISLTDSTLQYLGVSLAPSLWAMYHADYPQAFASQTVAPPSLSPSWEELQLLRCPSYQSYFIISEPCLSMSPIRPLSRSKGINKFI